MGDRDEVVQPRRRLEWGLVVLLVGGVLMLVPDARLFGAVLFWVGVVALLVGRFARRH